MTEDKVALNRVAPRLRDASAFLEKGRPAAAKAIFEEIEAEHPGNLAILTDIADRYSRAGRPGFEAQTLRKISEIAPSGPLFERLGDVYELLDKPYRAMCSFRSAVDHDSANPNYINKFYESLRRTPARLLEQDRSEIKQSIATCLRQGDVGHKRIMQTWVSLFLRDLDFEDLQDCFRREDGSWTTDEQEAASELLGSEYLILGLQQIPVIGDVNFESLMTSIRRFLLFLPPAELDQFEPFICALAEYCFGNEFVFWATPEEEALVENLRMELESCSLSEILIPGVCVKIALLGCYLQLKDLNNSGLIVEAAGQLGDSPFEQMVDRQIVQPRKCQEIALTIPMLSSIEDEVSSAVREMYEVNPYPRWRGLSVVSGSGHHQFGKGRNILVAGCGTGQEALSRSLTFPAASILGIDLSLASLSYAKFMASYYGVENLEFMQADILKAGQLEGEFDLIYSSGVLHHMDDPIAGWRQLITRLKSDGIMQISLYSEKARQDIVRCRDWIQEQGFDSTSAGIRNFRKQVLELDEGNPIKDIVRRKDFYSLSHCRDLVFHVQEHRFTFPMLKDALASLDLQLISIITYPRIRRRYREMFPADPGMRNLDNWDVFEEEYPEAFWGMYSFWCTRAGQAPRLPQWLG